MPPDNRLERFELGDWGTNCYLLTQEAGPATLIDAGFDPQAILDRLQEQSIDLEQVVLTHAHVDHIAGLPQVLQAHPGCRVLIHRKEAEFLGDPTLNLSAYLAEPFSAQAADGFLEAGEEIQIAGKPWDIHHTPGHSPGGITLVNRDQSIAIVGDTLFAQGIGRTDFPTSDGPTLNRSIREQLLTLPDRCRILPGHGPETTVGQERQSNPWLLR